jgi:hypothetical protein
MPANNCLRALAVALVAGALLAGCGGGSGSGGKTDKPLAEGVYFGLYTADDASTPSPVFGAVAPGSYAYFGTIHGALYVLPTKIEKGGFAGTASAWAPFNHRFDDGRKSRDYLLAGTAKSDHDTVTEITGVLSGDAGSGSFDLKRQDLSTPAPALADLAGTYQGYYWAGSPVDISLSLAADGSFDFSDGYGCSGSGTLSVVSGYNLLKVSLESTGNASCAGTVGGLGFTDTKDLGHFFQAASGTYIYFGASNSDTGLVALLYKSG